MSGPFYGEGFPRDGAAAEFDLPRRVAVARPLALLAGVLSQAADARPGGEMAGVRRLLR